MMHFTVKVNGKAIGDVTIVNAGNKVKGYDPFKYRMYKITLKDKEHPQGLKKVVYHNRDEGYLVLLEKAVKALLE